MVVKTAVLDLDTLVFERCDALTLSMLTFGFNEILGQ